MKANTGPLDFPSNKEESLARGVPLTSQRSQRHAAEPIDRDLYSLRSWRREAYPPGERQVLRIGLRPKVTLHSNPPISSSPKSISHRKERKDRIDNPLHAILFALYAFFAVEFLGLRAKSAPSLLWLLFSELIPVLFDFRGYPWWR